MNIIRSITSVLSFGLATLLLVGAAPSEKKVGQPNYGFDRPINPAWFPDDPRQWSQYSRSVFVTDLSQVKEPGALVTGQREKGKWKVLPYEAGDLKGNALSVYSSTEPPRVSIPLKTRGWHAVYIGLSTVSGGINKAQQSGITAKLGKNESFRRMQNNMRLTPTRGDVVQEQLLAVAELDPSEVVEIKPLPNFAATVMYIRLVPLADAERLAWEKEGRDTSHRSAVATWDGHSWIWPYAPRTASDLRSSFVGIERTDFNQWWFCVTGADLVNYPSKVGTIAGATTKDFPTKAHAEYSHSLVKLLENGVNPLLVARNSARDQGRQFHVFIRPQAWGASIPFEETFDSKFFLDHPEWRCVDREGKRTLHMSWAVPEVRKQILAVFRESVEMSDPDGVGIFFNRGMPLMLWEKAFSDRFRSEYGIDIVTVDAEDARIHQLRGKIMTEFMADLRALLDEIGKSRAGKRYTISASTLAAERFNTRFGMDLATWVERGLIDQLSIMAAYYTADGKLPYAAPDMAYYRKVVGNSQVKVFPFVVAWSTKLWNNGQPIDLCRLVLEWYEQGASGIAVWDPEQVRTGYGDDLYQGQPIDLLAYLGHRELIAHWAAQGVPLPHTRLVTKLGENEYSRWLPNTGY